MRIPAFSDYVITGFSGGTVTELESGMTNGMVEQSGGKTYATQRPSIDIFEDASAQSAAGRGRAIYYWDETSALYIVNDGTLYKTSQGSSLSTAPTAGTQKCKFLLLGSTLILLDAQNNQGFTISNADSVAEITDVDFPPKQTPAIPLAHGGAVLDGYLFVLGTNGIVYNSANGDASTWAALDFIEAEREPDKGVYLAKHHDQLVVFGISSIEFFYDAANGAGSPLNRRQDVSYKIGCPDGQSVWEDADSIYFVGVDNSGAFGVYVMQQFGIKKISNDGIDSFITQAVAKDGYSLVGCGLSAHGHSFYFLTLHTTPSDITPETTIVYDSVSGLWGSWDLTVNSLDQFPLVDWTQRQGNSQRYGEGILHNGDLISINDNLTPVDTLLASTYVVTDFVETGYVVESGDLGSNVVFKTRLGMFDQGSNEFKYPSFARHVSNKTKATQTLTLKWSNENNESFNTGQGLDASTYSRAHRLGRFRRRNHELEFSGDEFIRIEALEIE